MTSSSEFLILPHVVLGVATVLVSVVAFSEAWFAGGRPERQRRLAVAIFLLAWLTFLTGGYWYLFGYPPNKVLINEGNWPWAHNIVMEIKEHAFLFLLLVATILPAMVKETARMDASRMRPVVMTLTGLIIALGLLMEGMGAVVSLVVRMSIQ